MYGFQLQGDVYSIVHIQSPQTYRKSLSDQNLCACVPKNVWKLDSKCEYF